MPRSRSRSPHGSRRRRSRSPREHRERDRDSRRGSGRSRSPLDRARASGSSRGGRDDDGDRRRDRGGRHRDSGRSKDSEMDSIRPGYDREGNEKLDSKPPNPKIKPKKEKPVEAVDLDEDTSQMALLMGFNGFNTTKNQHVAANKDGSQLLFKARKYRQYMNRKGGFNRPLDAVK